MPSALPNRPAYLSGRKGSRPARSKVVNPNNPRYGAGTGWGSSTPFAPGTGWGESPNSWGEGIWAGGPNDWITDPELSNPGTLPPYVPGAPGNGGRPEFMDFGAYMPDYMGNIEGDWEYQGALTDEREGNLMQEAQTREALKALAIGFGGDLSSLLAKGLIDQETVGLAGQNEFSTMKELGRALERGGARTTSSMAARGGLGSGAEAALRSQLNENYQRQSTAAANALTQQVTGAQNALAQGRLQRHAGVNQARANVANRLYQQAMSQARPATRARWNPDLNAYEAVDGSGRLYDPNGNLVSGY